MIAPPPASAAPPPTVVAEEEEYAEGGDRPLWPWLVAVGFVVAAVIAGFFVWQELSSSTPQVAVELLRGRAAGGRPSSRSRRRTSTRR